MDSIVTLALVGTAHQTNAEALTGTPIDDLIAELPADQVERRLLLKAAALSIYRRAGYQPQKIASLPEAALPETLRACSPAVARLLSHVLQKEGLCQHLDDEAWKELLQEVAERLGQQGMYLPYNLLPLAFSVVTRKLRPAFLPVMGERGRWMSQFFSGWSWARDYIASDGNNLPDDAETIWQEGSTAQRVEILRLWRTFDPVRGRERLEEIWKQEKAEARQEFLQQALATSLSGEDEAFLERALDDRASGVRAAAVSMLTTMPASALHARMVSHASPFLQRVEGKIHIETPAAFVESWRHDGIEEKAPRYAGERAWWLIQILSHIDPTFWEAHLSAKPDALIKEVAEEQWGETVIQGWSKAAIAHRTSAWIVPLWDWWLETRERTTPDLSHFHQMRHGLLRLMPAQKAQEIFLTRLKEGLFESIEDLKILLSGFSRPWSTQLSQDSLQLLGQTYMDQKIEKFTYPSPAYHGLQLLPIVALAISPTCLAEAEQLRAGFPVLEEGVETNWATQQVQRVFQTFLEIIHLRKQIYEEII